MNWCRLPLCLVAFAISVLAGDNLRPLAGLTDSQKVTFQKGATLFKLEWMPAQGNKLVRDGLGPFFHAASCVACHPGGGRGLTPDAFDPGESLVFRIGTKDEAALDEYGAQLSPLGIPGVNPEGSVTVTWTEKSVTAADGTSWKLRTPAYAASGWQYGPPPADLAHSPRMAPALHGSGLLEAVPDETLLSMADPDDKNGDGISGRLNMEETWEGYHATRDMPGRFGWKAWMPTLLRQVCGALCEDMGITNYFNPHDTTSIQSDALGEYTRGGHGALFEARGGDPETLAAFCRYLAAPERRDADKEAVRQGETVFTRLNCQACHVQNLLTGPAAGVKALAGQTIHPFTDLLLHDMGPALADHRPEAKATGTEWRTAPLWGLAAAVDNKSHGLLLHDGRARSVEEAILWHDGEAATSRDAWKALTAADRAALLRFLCSL